MPPTLAGMLDSVFGGCPPRPSSTAVTPTQPAAAEKLKVIEMAVPQSVARFGLPAMPRKDKDFMPAFVLNTDRSAAASCPRGCGRRCARSAASPIRCTPPSQPFKHTSVFAGGVATKNEEIGQSLDLIRAELKRIAADGPTEKELADAKNYLTGSFALRFDSNAKIANQLLWFWQEGLGIDYVDKRNGEIEAVTLDDVKRAAKRLFEGQELIVTIVGKPKGLAATPQPRG